jgi:hypothetical protein
MFLINGVLWLVALPFRLVMWLVSLTVWTITLPLRVIWSVISFIGIGRLLTLGILGAAGYALWRLIADDEVPAPVAPPLEPVNVVAPAPHTGDVKPASS